jgi:hypothetical protein
MNAFLLIMTCYCNESRLLVSLSTLHNPEPVIYSSFIVRPHAPVTHGQGARFSRSELSLVMVIAKFSFVCIKRVMYKYTIFEG